jgi:hypothetical protein
MTFLEFLAQQVLMRLKRRRVMVFHDPQKRFAGIMPLLAAPERTVIDSSGDLIEAREQALEALVQVGEDSTLRRQLVIYVPESGATDDLERTIDPWGAFSAAGCVFPYGAGDDYRELCLQFLPEKAGRIEELFQSAEPPGVDIIDSLIVGSAESPILKAVLGADGPRDMIVRFLTAEGARLNELKATAHWIRDLKDLVLRTLGLRLDGPREDVASLQSQLWRYLLFSEFAADLPGDLPDALNSVPRAASEHVPFAKALCAVLRDATSTQNHYETAAAAVSADLHLEGMCSTVEDFGELDTFAFEERGFLRRFTRELEAGDIEAAAAIAAGRQSSFWAQRDASRAGEWQLATLCCRLLTVLDPVAAELRAQRSLDAWIEFHCTQFAPVDALHRALEQTMADVTDIFPPLEASVNLVREKYRTAADTLARRFQEAAAEGWPAPSVLRAPDIFDQRIEPAWRGGERVAFFMIDALSFELGSALAASLGSRHAVTVEPACSVLPSVTAAGMTALLPGAASRMGVTVTEGSIEGTIDGQPVHGPKGRHACFSEYIGINRCCAGSLDDIAEGRFPADIASCEIIVVHTADIDSLGETNPGFLLSSLPGIMRRIQGAVNKLADAGFHRAFLSADHGYQLLRSPGAGNAISKPPGQWKSTKQRVLLGHGTGDDTSFIMDSRAAGVRCSEPMMAFPRGFATYVAGTSYFHGGISPQECIIPVINAALRKAEPENSATRVDITLTYRGATSGRITSLVPTLELSYPAADLFGPASIRLLLVAKDSAGKQIGAAATSKSVDPATGLVELSRAAAIKVPLRINEGFEGTFTVAAMDPSTGATLSSIKLQTDFHH